jgi:NADH-quinone oxidoreductase subunit C
MTETLSLIRQRIAESSDFQGIVFGEIRNYTCIEVPVDKIIQISQVLKNDLAFDQLIDIVGVDRLTKSDRFEVIYNLWSNKNKERLFLRVKLDSKKPEVNSLSGIWSTANWEEREAYDMLGITFLNHPDLRRIYMMDEYEYFPLRKDYPLMGIPGAAELPKK